MTACLVTSLRTACPNHQKFLRNRKRFLAVLFLRTSPFEGTLGLAVDTGAVEEFIFNPLLDPDVIISHSKADMLGVDSKVGEEVSSLFTLTPNSSHFPQMVVSEEFNNVHQLIRTLFPLGLRNCPLAGRISHFMKNWEILTKDQNILDIVAGYKIPFLSHPVQKKTPKPFQWSQKQQYLIHQEIEQLLKKGAIQRARTLFWSGASPPYIYQIIKGFCIPTQDIKYQNHSVSGRLPCVRNNSRGPTDRQGGIL